MDSNEATRIVFSRIQKIDPENASKIMGLLLIQDHGEKEMIRLSFGPEALIHSVILKARKELGLGTNSNTPSTPSSPFLSHSPNTPLSRQNSMSSSSSRLAIPSNPFSGSSSWNFMDFQNPEANSSVPFCGNKGGELVDEFQLHDHLSFLNDGSPTNPEEFSSQQELWGGPLMNHKRSYSVSDVGVGSDYDPISGEVLGWKPCLNHNKGYLHGSGGDAGGFGSDGPGQLVGSPNSKIEMMEQCQELLRSRSLQHQHRLAAASQLMAASASFPYSGSKGINFLLNQQQNDSPRARLEKNHFLMNGGMDMVNPNSRQIYLTFPADSTFREEDVSNYFSIYGPVQDVRIPYQQKRMFGFVTFIYPETVKIILAKGNPHFVCDSRVLVKPYKEKGKIPDKYRKQPHQLERGEYLACGSPTGLDARDPYDIQLGPRMFYNNQDMLLRRKHLEEQADLQQALELQSRRLMGLQLLDVKKQHYNHQRAFSTGGIPFPSPTHSPSFFNNSLVHPFDRNSPESSEEKCGSPEKTISANGTIDEKLLDGVSVDKEGQGKAENVNGTGKESPQNNDSDLQESSEHNLPDSPFASPTKEGDHPPPLSNAVNKAEKNTAYVGVSAGSSTNNNQMSASIFPATSTLGMASFNSCYFQMPGIPSSNGAIGM